MKNKIKITYNFREFSSLTFDNICDLLRFLTIPQSFCHNIRIVLGAQITLFLSRLKNNAYF